MRPNNSQIARLFYWWQTLPKTAEFGWFALLKGHMVALSLTQKSREIQAKKEEISVFRRISVGCFNAHTKMVFISLEEQAFTLRNLRENIAVMSQYLLSRILLSNFWIFLENINF